MSPAELSALLARLVSDWESEVVEFKRAGDGFSTHDIGKYLSALANEANLRGLSSGWLVFGVCNKTRTAVGTDYRPEHARLQSLKHDLQQGSAGHTLREIHELRDSATTHRVLLFEIPAAPRGQPVAWQGHRYARAGESLVALPRDKEDEILCQAALFDWSAEPVPAATLADLDPAALAKAREQFARHAGSRVSPAEIAAWSDATLLEKLRLATEGRLLRAALLLLGRPESTRHLAPFAARITWKLADAEQAYHHYDPPFLLATSELWQRIRNYRVKITPANQLTAVEVDKYDQKIVLEALHNCVAHQDYRLCARIIVTERSDRLVFENAGTFFEGTVEDYVLRERTPRRYRNRRLAEAMAALGMIDTIGHGVRTMFLGQARRFFPLPDYEFPEPDLVRLTLHGHLIDENYSRLLLEKTDLPLGSILALDRVQKRLPVDDATLAELRRAKLVEGRRPHLHVAAAIAVLTGQEAAYLQAKGFDTPFYRQRILDLLKLGPTTRAKVDEVLLPYLPAHLSPGQKSTRIHHLLSDLRDDGLIHNQGGRRYPRWTLVVPKAVNEAPKEP